MQLFRFNEFAESGRALRKRVCVQNTTLIRAVHRVTCIEFLATVEKTEFLTSRLAILSSVHVPPMVPN